MGFGFFTQPSKFFHILYFQYRTLIYHTFGNQDTKVLKKPRDLPSGKCRSVVQGGPERSGSTRGSWSPWSTWSTLIHSDPHFWKFYPKCASGWIKVDLEDQGDHNPPWRTRSGFYIFLMHARQQSTKLPIATVIRLRRSDL